MGRMLMVRFDNLLMRFEEPSSMVRWDSPLISIPWDEDPPYEEIWNVVMKGAKKGPTAATLQVSSLSDCHYGLESCRVGASLMSALKTTAKRPAHPNKHNINNNFLPPDPSPNHANSIHIPHPLTSSPIRSGPTSAHAPRDSTGNAEVEETV